MVIVKSYLLIPECGQHLRQDIDRALHICEAYDKKDVPRIQQASPDLINLPPPPLSSLHIPEACSEQEGKPVFSQILLHTNKELEGCLWGG